MMRFQLEQPMASAPPLPPSPMTTLMIGTLRPNISLRFTAMASPCIQWRCGSQDARLENAMQL